LFNPVFNFHLNLPPTQPTSKYSAAAPTTYHLSVPNTEPTSFPSNIPTKQPVTNPSNKPSLQSISTSTLQPTESKFEVLFYSQQIE
jgi:hypothetical protein